jgi:prepilin-type N-terminal cleavage/methylation domain-containing protein
MMFMPLGKTDRSYRGRAGVTLVEVLVVVAIIAILMGVLLPSIQHAREAGRATACRQNLRQIGLAAHVFHGATRAFPPARILPRPGDVPQLSCGGQEPTWFIHLMPYLEEHAGGGWNVYEPFAQHPNSLRATPVSVYVCPTRRSLSQAAAGATSEIAANSRAVDMGVLLACISCSGGGWVPPQPPVDPEPGIDPEPPVPSAITGALGDYAGNHGDLSPGSTGAATDLYYGGNGSGVLITSRARCVAGRPMQWIDRIRIHDISDGLSNTFLAGERHVATTRLGMMPEDGSVYDGNTFHYASRLAGPGMALARSPDDLAAGVYAFGSWHQDVCHFVMADGSVRAVSDQTSSDVLGKLSNRHDGSPIGSF